MSTKIHNWPSSDPFRAAAPVLALVAVTAHSLLTVTTIGGAR